MVCKTHPATAEFVRATDGRIQVAMGLGETLAKPIKFREVERRAYPRLDGRLKTAEDVAYSTLRNKEQGQ
jgi:hypothetical protein